MFFISRFLSGEPRRELDWSISGFAGHPSAAFRAKSLSPAPPRLQYFVKFEIASMAHLLPDEGLPARVCFLGFGQRKKFALAANDLVASGEIKAPIGFSRDNLGAGSIANPVLETESMKDGSDAISEWPFIKQPAQRVSRPDSVPIKANGTMGVSHHTGCAIVADGTEEASLRIEACMTTDAGIVRYAQAGYSNARAVAEGRGNLTNEGIRVPLLRSPEATFGPDPEAE